MEKREEKKAYKPAEFTGALGKLSVSTLAAPKKTIDVFHTSGGDGESESEGVKRENSLWKMVMITIEEVSKDLQFSVLFIEHVFRCSHCCLS